MKDFEELMSDGFRDMVMQRQRLRLRYVKVRREIDNGKQKNL